MEAPLLVFRESLLSPWGSRRPQSRWGQPEGASPRFSTVGSLDSVNAQVAAAGLQRRALLPDLVGDCYSSEPLPPATDDMPPRRRAAGASARLQTKHITARKQGARGAPAQPSADMSREKPSPEEPEQKISLIELATFPGYTPSRPTPLPQSLDTLEQMRRVTQAQPKLAAQREGYREYWRENFYSTASQTIFLDTFWWFFLERYQPHKSVQSSLFSRVAENYVTFLTRTEIYAWKDKFLKAYPDALAQCVYTAFIHAYPASWGSFDDGFKSALVEIVYLWQTGTRPMPELWRRWNFKHLDPPDSLKTIGQEEEQVQRKKTFDLDTLVEEARTSITEEAPAIIEPLEDQTSSNCSLPAAHPSTSPPQERVTRAELEHVLSQRTPRHTERGEEGAGHTLSEGEDTSTLDVARTQYLSLCNRKVNSEQHIGNHDRGKVQDGGIHQRPTAGPLTQQSLSKHTKLPKPVPLSHNGKQKPARETTLCVPPPLPPRAPNKTTGGQARPQNSGERPPGALKPSTAAAELRGRATQNTRPSQRSCKRNSSRTRGPQHTGKTQTSPKTQGTHNKPPDETRRSTTSEATPPPRSEKPAGSFKPASAAEEYGLPNYVFEEGECSWKEKAITAREKTRQKPINILHRLHRHQGVPLAVPEMESVCFNQFGRSPLVKHFLQKRKLSKVTGYSILTKRTELNQVIPSGAPTYDDIIRESLRESKERTARLVSQRRQSKKQLRSILQERSKKRDMYKQQLRQLLSAQKEVESLSNELVEYWQQRGMDRQQGVASLKHTLSPDMQRTLSSCINQAFQRCSAHSSP